MGRIFKNVAVKLKRGIISERGQNKKKNGEDGQRYKREREGRGSSCKVKQGREVGNRERVNKWKS